MNEILPENVEKELVITTKDIEVVSQQYKLFLELQKNVLQPNVDYGFPTGKHSNWEGTKPSLYKAGAEKLAKIFKLYVDYIPEHIHEDEHLVFYRFKANVYHMPTGKLVAHGYGACSSKERKGWDENPLAFVNNIVKIARKRAFVDGILTATGASSAFTQDLEDEEEQKEEEKKITDKQMKLLQGLITEIVKLTECNRDEFVNELKQKYGVQHANELTIGQASIIIDELQKKIKEIKEQG